jgi:hypothetical protein
LPYAICVGLCVLLSVTWTSLAQACIYSKIPSTAEVFAKSSAVFVGVVTSAEILKPTNAEEKEMNANGVFAVWFKWKTEKVYKGHGIKGKSALTSTFHCGGIDITVGRKYVFAVYESEEEDVSQLIKLGVIGTLQSFGTSSELDNDRFRDLNEVYRRLSK